MAATNVHADAVKAPAQQPQHGQGVHDGIQYHFFAGDKFFSVRVIETKSLKHHSAWLFDGKAREIVNSTEPLARIGTDHYNVKASRFQITTTDTGGSMAVLGEGGRPDLAWVLSDLAARGVNELHLEAGARLNASLIQAGVVDEFLLYLAPKLIGPGRALADLPPLAHLADAPTLRFIDVQTVGDDLRIVARPPGRDLF